MTRQRLDAAVSSRDFDLGEIIHRKLARKTVVTVRNISE
jgi:hypothetical protein